MEVVVKASDLDEIEESSYAIFEHRRDEIVDGKLDGHHWFLALVLEVEALRRRSKVSRFRSESRI